MEHERYDRWAERFGRARSRRVVAKAVGGGVIAALIVGRASAVPARGQEATPGASPAVCPATTAAENTGLIEGYWAEVWTAGGEAAVPGFLAADEIHHWGVGGDTVGHAAFVERLRAFLTAFPDFAIRVDQLVAEGDLVASRWTATATHRGEWLGIPSSDRPVEYTGINVFRIACGKIAEGWGEADHLGLLRQLGAMPESGTPAVAPDADRADAASPAAACPMATAGQQRAVAGRWFADAVNPRDLALLDQIVAPDAVLHATGFPDATGPAAIRGLFEALFAGFSDLQFAVEPGPAEGDLVVERWTASGTHDGEFQGIAPTDQAMSWTGINVYRLECDRIVEVWTEADTLGRLRQLGALPEFATPAL